MRIVISVNTSWNIYNFRKGLLETLLQEGHEVIAVAPYDEYSKKLIEMGCIYHPISIENKGSNPIMDFILIFKYYLLYKKIRPAGILQYTIKPNIYGTIAARWLGIPVINTVTGLGTVFLHDNLVSKIAIFLYKFSFKSAHQVFLQNSSDLQLFRDKKIISSDFGRVIPGSGINIEKFKPGPYRKNKNFTFVLIARLLYDKGIVEYVEAIKILKSRQVKARFLLIGSLDPQSHLAIKEAELKDWMEKELIEYLKFTDTISSVIQNSDCVVLPSYREGTSKTLLEGAAMGKALIATDVPGCREIVEHEVNGYLCKVKDSLDLANKMQALYHLKDEALKEMGTASRKKAVELFDEKIVINNYLREIEKILNKKSFKAK